MHSISYNIDCRADLLEESLDKGVKGVSGTDAQCLKSVGIKPSDNGRPHLTCRYICGERILVKNGTDPAGSQCEHVEPVTGLANLGD